MGTDVGSAVDAFVEQRETLCDSDAVLSSLAVIPIDTGEGDEDTAADTALPEPVDAGEEESDEDTAADESEDTSASR